MKKPLLLFAVKCTVILYFAACTSIEDYTVARSATPIVTKGTWKVNLYADANNDKTNDFDGYTFTFNISGELTANRNGVDVNGNWAEDNTSKRITIDLGDKDPALTKLNNYWQISSITNKRVNMEHAGKASTDKLDIATL
jgi:hypothetical protein